MASGRKLTLNLGLRYETKFGWMPATCQEQTQFIAAVLRRHQRCSQLASCESAVLRRLRLMGDGMTALVRG
jgi:hypothetical protein